MSLIQTHCRMEPGRIESKGIQLTIMVVLKRFGSSLRRERLCKAQRDEIPIQVANEITSAGRRLNRTWGTLVHCNKAEQSQVGRLIALNKQSSGIHLASGTREIPRTHRAPGLHLVLENTK